MAKKAIVSTVIFTLIIINLIMWPTLFSDFKEGNVKVSSEQSDGLVIGHDESVESDLDLDGEADSDLANEEVADEGEESGNETTIPTSEKKVFKILRIE